MSIARSTTSACEPVAIAPRVGRRRFLSGAAAAVAVPWLARGARGADIDRFALGIASGQPRADGVVLWTRLTGDALGERIAVQWEVASDERFADDNDSAEERRPRSNGGDDSLPLDVLPPAIGREPQADEAQASDEEQPRKPRRRARPPRAPEGDDEIAPAA